MHATDGQLKACLDGETDAVERQALDRHLAECDRCRVRLGELTAQGDRVRSHFAAWSAQLPAGPTARAALARFRAEHDFENKESLMTRLFGRKYRIAWGVAAILAVLLVAFSFEPVRVWAGGL